MFMSRDYQAACQYPDLRIKLSRKWLDKIRMLQQCKKEEEGKSKSKQDSREIGLIVSD